MEWLQFILALAGGREHAVVVARASDLSSPEELLLTTAWYLALGCLALGFLDRPWVARKLEKLGDSKLYHRLTDGIAPEWRVPAVFAICFAPSGFWLGILLMTLWQYRWYQRILLVTAGNTASYFAYEFVMTPFLALLGPYLLLAIPALLCIGIIIKNRGRLAAAGNWSLQQYRLIVSRATS